MAWVAMESQILKLKDYALMQIIKRSSTFRVSPKGEKPSPRIVYRYGKQDGKLKNTSNIAELSKTLLGKLASV